jgi:hypothetical protein
MLKKFFAAILIFAAFPTSALSNDIIEDQMRASLATIASVTSTNPCANPQATLVSVTGATSTNNATQIVALSGTTKIFICSMTVVGVSGTSPTFSLVYGTGTNCATGQTTLVQAFSTTANQSYLFQGPVAVSPAGNAVCYKDGGTSPVENYQITYVQI